MVRWGIAPLTAVLVLIVITVVSTIITYFWVTSYTKSLSPVSEPVQLSEVLKIEGASHSNRKIQVTVQNIGSKRATIAAVYILNQDRVAVFARTDLSIDLEPGAAASIEVEAELSTGTYIVKLVTRTGVEATTVLRWVAGTRPREQPPEAPSEQLREVILRITVEPPDGGRTNPPAGEHRIPAGTRLTVTAQSDKGYVFSHWLLNGTYYSNEQSITLTINGDTNLTAVFEPRRAIVRIAVDPPNGGFTDPQPGVYEVPAGTKLNATATPYEGFLFIHWLLNGKIYSSERSITIVVYEDTELTAVFIEQQRGTPSFRITYLSEHVSGPVGSTQTFTIRVKNVGDATGDALVKILDDGRTVASQLVTLQPEEEKSVSLAVQLPGAHGVYTWRVVAENIETGGVDDEKTFTVEAKDLYLARRSALYYTGFEGLPDGWTALGGTWTIAPGEGTLSTHALRGSDDNRGPGGASLYCTRVSAVPTVYLAVQLYVPPNTPVPQRPDMMGIAILSPTATYAAIVDYRVAGGDRGFEVHRLTNQGWVRVASVRFTPSPGAWYTLIVELSGNRLSAHLYGDGTSYTLRVQTDGLAPERVGVIIDDAAGLFDNFVVSSASPEHIVVSGLQQGWVVELYSGNTLVGRATADASGSARIRAVTSLIVINARIVVKDAQDNTIIERSFTEVVGGDEYVYGT